MVTKPVGAVASSVYYRTHVQNIGWQGWVRNGIMSGSVGLGYRLEAIEIKLVQKGSAKKLWTVKEGGYTWDVYQGETLTPTELINSGQQMKNAGYTLTTSSVFVSWVNKFIGGAFALIFRNMNASSDKFIEMGRAGYSDRREIWIKQN